MTSISLLVRGCSAVTTVLEEQQKRPRLDLPPTNTTNHYSPAQMECISKIEAMANEEVGNDMEEDYKMFLNTCRFVQYALKSYKSGTILNCYKRFCKTQRYINIKGVDYHEFNTPNPTTQDNTPKRGRPRWGTNPTLQDNQGDAEKKPKGRPRQSQQTITPDPPPSTNLLSQALTPFTNYSFYTTILSTTPSSSNLIHSLCSTLHSEFDLFVLNTDLLQNRYLPTFFLIYLIIS